MLTEPSFLSAQDLAPNNRPPSTVLVHRPVQGPPLCPTPSKPPVLVLRFCAPTRLQQTPPSVPLRLQSPALTPPASGKAVMKQAAPKPFSLVSYTRWTTSPTEFSQTRPARRVRDYPGYVFLTAIKSATKDASSSPQIMTLHCQWYRLLGKWSIFWPSIMKVMFALKHKWNIVIYDHS